MTRKLVVFNDHSWIKPQQRSGKRAVTGNATLAFQCLLPETTSHEKQISFLQNDQIENRRFTAAFSRLTGLGLRREIFAAYQFLMQNYMHGDEIYLFGAGRGAFTMQCLAEMISISGLLHIDSNNGLMDAYNYSRLSEKARNGVSGKALRSKFEARSVSITFLGCWDPVGHMGAPTFLLRSATRLWSEFHRERVSANTKSVYQALALDEVNTDFKPNVLLGSDSDHLTSIEQVWFAGKHSNVTGGQRDSRLSDIALRWMIGKAIQHGLNFDQEKLDDLTTPDPLGCITPDTWRSRLKARLGQREKIRTVGKADAAFSRIQKAGTEKIHVSVKSKERKEPHYSPQALAYLPLGSLPICQNDDLPKQSVRKFERLPVNCPATVLVSSSRFNGNLLDFSEGGARLWVPLDLPVGTPVTIRSSLLFDEEKTGHVVWIKNQSLGLDFSGDVSLENTDGEEPPKPRYLQ
ncbi:phospholipase effector Tle1 domain-containing protein [Sneathiella sp.]|jgi:hypothetical protein|uniref:phospholipase effector Tle1 domain-containing protein n=1 Tax=Sneathiella sp. TaxID=1964365 RepID=UPI0039E2BA9A